MPFPHRSAACALGALAASAPACAADDIVVTAQPRPAFVGSVSTIDADAARRTIDAVNVEDMVKYLPSLIVRKRHVGDTQAPLATRTSGGGSSARSLIYADGALLSALIGNNNGTASPRWSLVSSQEVARIDVLYGPFGAAYPGNSIGAVVSITTRLPERLEANATASTSVQRYSLYGASMTAPARQIGGTIGDRLGRLALFASVDHVASLGQPLSYVTAPTPAALGGTGTATTGGADTLNRTGAPIRVLGAGGIEHQVQDRLKLKAAFDLTSAIRLQFVGGLFLDATEAGTRSFLTDQASGLPAYAGSLAIAGRLYSVPASAFDAGLYRHDERHWSHALSATGTGAALDWRVIATRYRFAHDVQRAPTGTLPAAFAGGAGTITRLDGTGWETLDASLRWTPAHHALSVGGHADRFVLASDRYATADWIGGSEGALTLRSAGRTRTAAVWAEEAWTPLEALTFTFGARAEWWRAYRGQNVSTSPAIAATQPELAARRLSPKATLAWSVRPGWTARLSYGDAYRFPTVSELYQIVTTPIAAVPNPTLRPEYARSAELAIEQAGAHGTLRLAVFSEAIADALVSQLGPLNGGATLATFVQNVDRTRARGVEAAFTRTDLLPHLDLSGSVTYVDATTRADTALPAAVGKRLPQVPRWKATLVATWRPTPALALTAAGRYASRQYGTIDNSDPVAFTYQGFGRYLVLDLRALAAIDRHWSLGLGVDNLTDDRYFLFHPFPARTVHADLSFKL